MKEKSEVLGMALASGLVCPTWTRGLFFLHTTCSLTLFRSLLTLVAVALFATTASAQTVSFGRINDATPGYYFDALNATADGNTLTVPIASGLDDSFNDRAFLATPASGLPGCFFCWAFHQTNVSDTFTVFVVAPDGYVIDTITYNQGGSRSTSRGDKTFSSTTMTVNGTPSAAVYQTPALSLVASNVDEASASVTVTTTLEANPGASTVTSASLVVTLRPAN